MTVESDNQPTKWYKHMLFLIVLNFFVGTILWIGIREVIDYMLPVFYWGSPPVRTSPDFDMTIGVFIGMLMGGSLGYTLWATTDNFPQSRAVLLSGLWAGTFGIMLLIVSTIGCFSFVLAFISFFVTLGLLEKWDQGWSVFIATSYSIFTIFITSIFISSNIISFSLGILVYSITLIYLLQQQNERLRRENAERAQRQQLQNDLSVGLLPEENYTVSDDGELIPVDKLRQSR